MSHENAVMKPTRHLSTMAKHVNEALDARNWLDLGLAAGEGLSKALPPNAKVLVVGNAVEVDGFPQGVRFGLRRSRMDASMACIWLRYFSAMGERIVVPYGESFDPDSGDATVLVIASPRAMPLQERLMIEERVLACVGSVRFSQVIVLSPFLDQGDAEEYRAQSALPPGVAIRALELGMWDLGTEISELAPLRRFMSGEPFGEARTMPEAMIRRAIELGRLDPAKMPADRRPSPID